MILIFAIGAIAACTITALFVGIDGAVYKSGVAIIGGFIGYILREAKHIKENGGNKNAG